jgi:hypothetical protein
VPEVLKESQRQAGIAVAGKLDARFFSTPHRNDSEMIMNLGTNMASR